jgi:pyridoxal phosphate enzyme (YggS family)
MSLVVNNLNNIEKQIKSKVKDLNIIKFPKIIAVSKTFKLSQIMPIIEYGHCDFGENKVQEALEKWSIIKEKNKNIKLHLIGKLQTNKVKLAVQIFDYIHSVDNERLAKKIADEQKKINKKIKIFLQVNIGNESQKSGIDKNYIKDLVSYCNKIELNVIGLMCIPPVNIDPENHFKEMSELNKSLGFKELSMGMSSDFLVAIKHTSTYVRVGSGIFGPRY